MVRFPLALRRSYRELTRMRQIAEVLIRNGLGVVVSGTELRKVVSRRWRGEGEDAPPARELPVRVRRTLEELGPTFIKMGQLLSGRGDLLPPAYLEELSKLLDAAPPFPFEEVVAQLEGELGAPLSRFFAHIEDRPIASASIGQVHRAVLVDGDHVVIKVQRPNVEQTVQADLDLLRRQARLLERYSETLRAYRLVEIVDGLRYALENELDYTVEAQNAERFARQFAGDLRVLIPRIYWSLTTKRVLTMQAIEGISLTQRARLEAEGYDLPAVARLLIDIYLEQIFVHGFFHADPHPANLFVVDHRMALLDFGMVGFLTPQMRDRLSDLLVAVVEQNPQAMVTALVRMGAITRRTVLKDLERDLQRILVRYAGLPLHNLRLGAMLTQIFATFFRHQVRLPSDMAMLIRTLIVMEGVARSLDPEVVVVGAVEPFVRELIRERFSPRRIGRQVLRTAEEANEFLQRLPRRIDDLWDQLEDGEVTLGISVRDLEELARRADKITNRIAFSIVLAALIVGSALILLGGKLTFELPWVGIGIPLAQVTFVLAVLAGAWLLWSILRSRGL